MANIWEGSTPLSASTPVADPGLAAHLKEFPGPDEGVDSDPFEGSTPISSTKPSAAGQFFNTLGSSLAKRSGAQGKNIVDVAKSLLPIPSFKEGFNPTRPPLPGNNPVEKVLNVARLLPPWAVGEMLTNPVAAVSTAVSEATGAPTREKAEEYGDYAGALTAILGGFAPTGSSSVAKGLQRAGIGRPNQASRAAQLQEEMKAKFPTKGAPADIPLSYAEQFDIDMANNPNRYDDLRGLFDTGGQGGKKVKTAPMMKKLSNISDPFDKAARQDIGSMSRAASPSVEEINQGDLAELRRLLNLGPPEGVPTTGRQAGPGNIFEGVPPYQTEAQALQAARDAAEGRLPVPPGTGLRRATPPSDPTATGYPPGQPTPPPAPQSTLIEALAKGPDEGMAALTQMVEPPPTATPKPGKAAPVVEPMPDAVSQRMQELQYEAEHASGQPYGKQYGSTIDEGYSRGQTIAIGDAGSFKEQFRPLYNELRAVPDGVGPKAIATAIKKDKDNKLYTMIKDAIKRDVESEGVSPRSAADDLTVYPKMTQEDLNMMQGAKPTQPPLLPTQATMPPTPLQGKAPQVEHGQLLEGFKQAEPEPPRLPLGEEPNTVEFGMGLPVHKLGQAMKRMVQGFDDDTQPVGWFQSGRVQLNRMAPGLKTGDKIEAAKGEYRALQGTSQQVIDKSGMNGLTRPELTNLMQVQEGRARPMNEKVAKAASLVNQEREVYSSALQEVGAKVMVTRPYTDKVTGARGQTRFWKPYEARTNYVPHLPDNREIVKDSAEAVAAEIQRWNKNLRSQDSRHVADILLARANGKAIPRTVPDHLIEWIGLGQPKSAHLFQRSGLIFPDKYRLLPNEAWPAYFQSTSREIALARQIGPADRDIEALRKIATARKDDAALEALDTFDYWRGNKVQDPAARWQDKLIALGRNITTMRFMGPTTAIKQGSQAVPIFAETSVKNFVKGVRQSFRASSKDEAQRAGAHLDDLMRELTSEHLALSEAMHPSQSGLDRALTLTERGAAGVSKVSGITAHDRFWRTVGFKAFQSDFNDAIVAAKKGKTSAVSLLKEHGLTPTSTAQQVDRAAAAFSAKVNLQSDPISLPAFIYKMPMLRLVTHLQRFTIGQQQRMVRDFAVPFTKAIINKDRAALQRHALRIGKLLGGGVLVGEGLGDVLRTIAGRPDDRPGGTPQEFLDDLLSQRVPASVIAKRIGDNLLFAAFLGYAQTAKEALLDPTTKDAKSLRIASMILGPVGSSVVEGATRLSQLATADTEPSPKTGKSEMDRAKMDTARTAVGSLTGVGRTVSQWTFPHAKGSDKNRAINGWTRAMSRDEPEKAKEWLDWYRDRQGQGISATKLYEKLDEYNR